MSIDWRELRLPLIVFPILLIGLWLFGDLIASEETRRSLLTSGLMCFGHVVSGVVILDWAAGRPPMSFLKRVLGGMGIRLFVMLGVVAVLLNVHAFEATSLMLGLLGWYALALVFEVVTLQKKVAQHQERTARS